MFISFLKSRVLRTIMMTLFLFLAFHSITYADDHLIPSDNIIEEYYWTYGCTPTASSIVLGYWDNYGWMGRLVDWYYNQNTCGWPNISGANVPNTIEELRSALGTNYDPNTCTGDGGTNPVFIEGGIRTVTNDWNGYNFTFWTCWDILGSFLDWCWGEITTQINNGRPFVWSRSTGNIFEGFPGHSVAAYGYTDDKYVIVYDTWPNDTALPVGGREDWYYRYWYNPDGSTAGIASAQVNAVIPHGWSDSDVNLDDPNGGETIKALHPFTIWWYQWGTSIVSVDLDYSVDGGNNWTVVGPPGNGYWMPSVEGWNSFTWNVPNISSSNARVRIAAYDTNVLVAGDGSFGNFTIQQPVCSPLYYPTDKWQRVWYDYPAGNCLGNGPDEYNEQFSNSWGTGEVAHSRSDNIQFTSSRAINLSGGNYRITVGSDDGVRLWIDNNLKIDMWVDRPYATDTVDVSLSAGYHNFRINYYENAGGAGVSFELCVPRYLYRDADGDGYGNPALPTKFPTCDPPSPGWVEDNTDCNDGNASVHPGVTEVCNGIDDNCNGQIDEGGVCGVPDLLVSAWTAPANACGGAQISIKDTTKNQGTGTAGVSQTCFYFSTNQTLDTGDTKLACRAIPGLAPATSSPPTGKATTNVTLPNVPIGKYYLIAMADDGKVVTESNETNNKKSKVIYIGPDLDVISIVPSPLKPVAGQNVNITATVKNVGCPAAGPFRVDFYKNLSTAPAVNQAGDFNCSKVGLAAGASATCTFNVNYSPAGTYKMWVQADTMQQVTEGNETNNKMSRSITVNP